MQNAIHKLSSMGLLFLTLTVSAQTTNYHLLVPSRDGQSEQLLQIVENNGTKLLTMASCAQCMPATYTYNRTASKAAGKPVYGSSGIYVIAYDDNSYAAVAPKSPLVALGEGIWQTFLYVNFFSEDQSKVTAMTKSKVEHWAVQLSKKIMEGEIATASFDPTDNRYYSALQPSKAFTVDQNDKTITIGNDTFYYAPDFSKVLGIKVYSNDSNRREHVFIESSVAIIWAKYGHGNDLGKSDWGEQEKFNYYHKNQQEIRSLLTDKAKRDKIDTKLTNWSAMAKKYVASEYARKETEEIKNRRLPTHGLKNRTLEAQALAAARKWANDYGWEETISDAYFTGNNWNIYRNSLTGVQLGRRIAGVIVMKRKDGACSFHYATFAQQYSGSGYQKVFTEGITPGQNILLCKNVH